MINNTVLWNNYALRSSPTLREPYQSIDQWAGSIVLARNKERKDLWRQQQRSNLDQYSLNKQGKADLRKNLNRIERANQQKKRILEILEGKQGNNCCWSPKSSNKNNSKNKRLEKKRRLIATLRVNSELQRGVYYYNLMKMSKNARKEIDNMVNSLAIKKEIKERPQQANSRANEQIHVNFMSLTINHVLGRRRNITKSKTETQFQVEIKGSMSVSLARPCKTKPGSAIQIKKMPHTRSELHSSNNCFQQNNIILKQNQDMIRRRNHNNTICQTQISPWGSHVDEEVRGRRVRTMCSLPHAQQQISLQCASKYAVLSIGKQIKK